eukprot:GFUD01126746.1.p1 GENE.GFUD01126746.1~~GFUD01126746.1.p1  ORF type:complete len:107 (+),score=16.03 GFUD01126746.1:26-346(+)
MTRLILHTIWIFSTLSAVAEGICCPSSIFKYECEDGTTVFPWQCCSTETCNIFCCNCGGPCRSPNETVVEAPKELNELQKLFFSNNIPIIQVLKKRKKRNVAQTLN